MSEKQKVIMTQQTSKVWKAVQLAGFAMTIAGVVMFFGESDGIKIGGVLLVLFGILVFAMGRILAWWFHG